MTPRFQNLSCSSLEYKCRIRCGIPFRTSIELVLDEVRKEELWSQESNESVKNSASMKKQFNPSMNVSSTYKRHDTTQCGRNGPLEHKFWW
jgi:hypothetical protein